LDCTSPIAGWRTGTVDVTSATAGIAAHRSAVFGAGFGFPVVIDPSGWLIRLFRYRSRPRRRVEVGESVWVILEDRSRWAGNVKHVSEVGVDVEVRVGRNALHLPFQHDAIRRDNHAWTARISGIEDACT